MKSYTGDEALLQMMKYPEWWYNKKDDYKTKCAFFDVSFFIKKYHTGLQQVWNLDTTTGIQDIIPEGEWVREDDIKQYMNADGLPVMKKKVTFFRFKRNGYWTSWIEILPGFSGDKNNEYQEYTVEMPV